MSERTLKWGPGENRGGPPEPGYYAVKLVRGGWKVPCHIWRDGEMWRCSIDGEEQPGVLDPAGSESLMMIWHHGERRTEDQHRFFTGLKLWARDHYPDHPCLHPREPVQVANLLPVIP